VGGRCYTDTRTFGIPYDRGAHWIHMPDTNPVAKSGLKTGVNIYAAPPSQRLRIGLRYARDKHLSFELGRQLLGSPSLADLALRAAAVTLAKQHASKSQSAFRAGRSRLEPPTRGFIRKISEWAVDRAGGKLPKSIMAARNGTELAEAFDRAEFASTCSG
jgi:hypothetical protein